MFGHQRLKCYQLALETAKMMPELTHAWPKGSGYLADQLRRAIASVVLNISEGYGRCTIQERRRFCDIATGSAFEVASIFDIAIAQNFESFKRGQSIKSKMFLVAKMLERL